MNQLLLQDWTSVSAFSGLTQTSTGWLDVSEYEDLTIALQVSYLSSALHVSLTYDTSPSLQESSFVPMNQAFTVAVGTRVDTFLSSNALVPPARYLRWRLATGFSAGKVTFRILVGAYSLTI